MASRSSFPRKFPRAPAAPPQAVQAAAQPRQELGDQQPARRSLGPTHGADAAVAVHVSSAMTIRHMIGSLRRPFPVVTNDLHAGRPGPCGPRHVERADGGSAGWERGSRVRATPPARRGATHTRSASCRADRASLAAPSRARPRARGCRPEERRGQCTTSRHSCACARTLGQSRSDAHRRTLDVPAAAGPRPASSRPCLARGVSASRERRRRTMRRRAPAPRSTARCLRARRARAVRAGRPPAGNVGGARAAAPRRAGCSPRG